MPARRFTIVCLMTALYGICLATLVARSNETPGRWHSGQVVSCAFGQGLSCRTLFH